MGEARRRKLRGEYPTQPESYLARKARQRQQNVYYYPRGNAAPITEEDGYVRATDGSIWRRDKALWVQFIRNVNARKRGRRVPGGEAVHTAGTIAAGIDTNP